MKTKKERRKNQKLINIMQYNPVYGYRISMPIYVDKDSAYFNKKKTTRTSKGGFR